ncbi:Lrp/AsnC family transcriptional regulator [Latilactobacillus curvatus]
MDQINNDILNLLRKNGRLSNKEIGKMVHLTGQAVGQRISSMIEDEIIAHFTVSLNYKNRQFIRIFMNNNHFSDVESAINQYHEVDSFYKVSGQACYIVTAHFNQEQLSVFINHISNWARYSIEVVLKDVKDYPK